MKKSKTLKHNINEDTSIASLFGNIGDKHYIVVSPNNAKRIEEGTALPGLKDVPRGIRKDEKCNRALCEGVIEEDIFMGMKYLHCSDCDWQE